MAAKDVTEPFLIFNQVPIGVGQVVQALPTSIKRRDNVAIQLQWTGAPVGTFDVQVSNDFNPGLPQASQSSGQANNGTWTSVPLSSVPSTSGNTAGTIALTQLPSNNIRVVYNGTSGSGTLTGILTAKSLG